MNPNLELGVKARNKSTWPLIGKEDRTKEVLWEPQTNMKSTSVKSTSHTALPRESIEVQFTEPTHSEYI